MKKIILGIIFLLMSVISISEIRDSPYYPKIDFPTDISYNKSGYECFSPKGKYVWQKDGLYMREFYCDHRRARNQTNRDFMYLIYETWTMRGEYVVIKNKYLRHKNDLNFRNDKTVYFKLHVPKLYND